MSTVLDVVTAVLLITGSVLALTAAIGLLRFPDVVTRMHAGTKPQTLGLLLVLIGTALQLPGSIDLGILVLAGLFQLITAPLIAQRVGKAAYEEDEAGAAYLVRDEWATARAAQDDTARAAQDGPARAAQDGAVDPEQAPAAQEQDGAVDPEQAPAAQDPPRG